MVKKIKKPTIAILIFIVAFIVYSKNIQLGIDHPDESFWIRSAYFFKLFFVDRDFYNTAWKSWSGYNHPQIGKYLIGMGFFLTGQKDKIGQLPLEPWWDFEKKYDWNLTHLKMPSCKELYISKMIMVLFASLTCTLVFYISTKICGIMSGILSVIFLIFNYYITFVATRVILDSPLNFFITLNILLLILFHEAFSKNNIMLAIFLAILIGFNASLAAGIKLGGVLTLLICIAYFLLILNSYFFNFKLLLRNKLLNLQVLKIRLSLLFISVVLIGVISTTIFYLSNPSLYRQPIKNVNIIADHSINIKLPFSYYEKLNLFSRENPESNISRDYQSIFFDSFKGVNLYLLKRTFTFPTFINIGYYQSGKFSLLIFILFLLGLFGIIKKEVILFKKNYAFSDAIVVVIWFFITYAIIAAYIRVDWYRYYIPLIISTAIFIGYGITRIFKVIYLLTLRLYRLYE